MPEEPPKVAKEEPLIQACPLCGVGFQEPLNTNVKHTCPQDGGCGQTFKVVNY